MIIKNYSRYLTGGGEMGALTRSFDWSKTAIGHPETWPISLLTTISIILSSKFPMFLFWGPDLIQFYNDGYRPSFGNSGKHPRALGQRGEECWPEIWSTIKPLIDQVMSDGESILREDQLIPIYRNGKLEDVYWTFCHSKVVDEFGNPGGVLVICNETTKQVNALSKLSISREQQNSLNEELVHVNKEFAAVNTFLNIKNAELAASESQLKAALMELANSEARFQEVLLRAPIAMAIFSGPNFIIELANDKVLEYWGRTLDQILNLPLFEAMPEARGQGFEELLESVLLTGKPYVANELPVTLFRQGKLEETWINFLYDPIKDAEGQLTKILVVCMEVTDQVNARNAIEITEEKLQHAIASAELGTWYFNIATKEFTISSRFREIFNFNEADEVTAKVMRAHIQQDYQDAVTAATKEATLTGSALNIEFPITGYPGKPIRWVRATGKYYQAKGTEPEHLSGTIADITEIKASQQRKEENIKQELKEREKQNIFKITIKTQEEERKRIAESLHNGIGQLLYAVKIELGQLRFGTNSDAEQQIKYKGNAERLLAEAIRESRRISHQLTPVLLDDYGLKAAIKDVCEQFSGSLVVNCSISGLETDLNQYLEVSVYRIIQELVLNLVKHANASQANVQVIKENDFICISVADNGIGFNYKSMRNKGIGLSSIFNKVKMLNGTFKIDNTHGTEVKIMIPSTKKNEI